MRIIGGAWRGRVLAEVGAGDPTAQLRPTSDRVRESIFNLLINGVHGNRVEGMRVLDLFAGTGALGLEALSRGASFACFVEDGAIALALITRNIQVTRAEGRTQVLRRDATRLGPVLEPPFDLVFLDPPYGRGLCTLALAAASDGGWLSPDALVVCEENAPMLAPEAFERLDHRRYGDTHVTLLRPRPRD